MSGTDSDKRLLLHKAERGRHHVELIVQDYGMAPGTASISVKVRRT